MKYFFKNTFIIFFYNQPEIEAHQIDLELNIPPTTLWIFFKYEL